MQGVTFYKAFCLIKLNKNGCRKGEQFAKSGYKNNVILNVWRANVQDDTMKVGSGFDSLYCTVGFIPAVSASGPAI